MVQHCFNHYTSDYAVDGTHPSGQAGRYHRPLIQEQRRSERLRHSLRSLARITLARLQTLHLASIQGHSVASKQPRTRSHHINCRRGVGRADATLHRIDGPNEGIQPGHQKCSQSLHQRFQGLPFKNCVAKPLVQLQIKKKLKKKKKVDSTPLSLVDGGMPTIYIYIDRERDR